jgi:hypothetical protein
MPPMHLFGVLCGFKDTSDISLNCRHILYFALFLNTAPQLLEANYEIKINILKTTLPVFIEDKLYVNPNRVAAPK